VILSTFNRSNKAISAAADGLYIFLIAGRIAEALAKAFDGRVDAMLKIYKNITRPQCMA
jgi:hypothetical protein